MHHCEFILNERGKKIFRQKDKIERGKNCAFCWIFIEREREKRREKKL